MVLWPLQLPLPHQYRHLIGLSDLIGLSQHLELLPRLQLERPLHFRRERQLRFHLERHLRLQLEHLLRFQLVLPLDVLAKHPVPKLALERRLAHKSNRTLEHLRHLRHRCLMVADWQHPSRQHLDRQDLA